MTAAIHYRPRDLDVLAELEERHFWFRARRRIIVDAMARWFGGARSYLEIGCGTGYNARAIQRALPKLRVVASDALGYGDVLRVDARDIPFEGAFDVVGAYDVLEHIDDDGAALRQFHKACRPGGGVLLTVPQHQWLWSATDEYAQHRRRYSARALHALLRRSGFEISGSTSFQTVNLLPFVLRARLLTAAGRTPAARVPAAPLNWALEQGMEVDRWLIRAGLPLPLGASRLIAARRVER